MKIRENRYDCLCVTCEHKNLSHPAFKSSMGPVGPCNKIKIVKYISHVDKKQRIVTMGGRNGTYYCRNWRPENEKICFSNKYVSMLSAIDSEYHKS